jgi:hypothetical protein
VNKPTVVCLCGSSRFKGAFEAANRTETLAGRIVLSIGMFGHHEGLDMNGPVKAMLDRLHLGKIDLATEVLILNVDGYVGESTRRELAYARASGKVIRWLEPEKAIENEDETAALAVSHSETPGGGVPERKAGGPWE